MHTVEYNHIGCKSVFHCLRTSIIIHTVCVCGFHLIHVGVIECATVKLKSAFKH